jgi:hypothetical protein
MWNEVGFPALLVAYQRSGYLGGDPSVKFEASRGECNVGTLGRYWYAPRRT